MDEIHFLPALPDEFSKGTGYCFILRIKSSIEISFLLQNALLIRLICNDQLGFIVDYHAREVQINPPHLSIVP
jgi:hypothetical protein